LGNRAGLEEVMGKIFVVIAGNNPSQIIKIKQSPTTSKIIQ
jgi:hypothetical protein